MAANALVVVSNEANVMLTKTREYFIVHSFLNESVSRYFVEVTARIFESVIILVLLASLELKNKYKIIVVGLFIIFIIYQFISKIDIPYFGYGI